MEKTIRKGIAFALLAAALYAVNAPFSKLLLTYMPATLMAGFLYIGAGLGMLLLALIRKMEKTDQKESSLTKKELPYTVAMILLDIAAPICLLFGLNATTAANASLLNNFEIVATALVALLVFREKISPRLWLGILFVTLSCAILSFEDLSSLQFSYGSLLVLLAAVRDGFRYHRAVYRRTHHRILEHTRSVGSGICGLRVKHLFLCIRPEASGSGKDKRLLCGCAFYCRPSVPCDIPGNAFRFLFCRPFLHGHRSLAFLPG